MTHASSRRQFLTSLTGGLLAAPLLKAADTDGRPTVTRPRATDGDERFEPDWDERLTVTVGPDKADINGRDDRAIQAALDYMTRFGGGTVRLLPGTYTLRNSVVLPSRVRLAGSGPDTIITRGPSVSTPLTADSDWYDQEITLQDGSGFRVGDGVVLRAKNPHHGGATVIKRTLVARNGNRFKLSNGLRENLWLSGTPVCANLFPLLTSEHTADVLIENLTIDGNRTQVAELDGNYSGCIFLQDCNRYTIRNVETRQQNGDGISFQICHDVVVENCHSHDNAGLGVHPGSGSQRPLIRNCRLERNNIGLFWCWGVKYGLAEGNRIVGNRYGISIGHNDTDNVMRGNEVLDSGLVGVLFRNEARGQDFWPNRNTLENNRIVNSGGEDAAAIDIQGKTRDITLTGNVILEQRSPAQRIGIRISPEAGAIALSDNRIEGFSQALMDQRPA